jgi:hypothetical protein
LAQNSLINLSKLRFLLDKRANFLYDRTVGKLRHNSGVILPMEDLISQLNAMQRVIQQLMERL